MCKGKVDFAIWKLNSGLDYAQLANVDCPVRNNRHLMLDSCPSAQEVHCQYTAQLEIETQGFGIYSIPQ
jgi:hypothetical protein